MSLACLAGIDPGIGHAKSDYESSLHSNIEAYLAGHVIVLLLS